MSSLTAALDAEPDMARRFGGVSRLYGEAALQRFQAAHLCVIGIGGVGSWAVEALARNAIGQLTLIDLDHIAESNINRQLHALESSLGQAKVTAMAERVRQINPLAVVHEVEAFVDAENVATLLDTRFDLVLDAIDDAKAKVAIALWCRQHQVSLVMVGGAGGRFDPTSIKVADMVKVTGDRLLAKVRNTLRRDHGFSRDPKARYAIRCVYSDEQVIKPANTCEADAQRLTGINCAGYGSSVCVTAPMGMAAAGLALKQIAAT